MEDLPLFPDLDLDEATSMDLTDLDMSGLDRINLSSVSIPPPDSRESISSFESLDESQIGETFVNLNEYPNIITGSVKVRVEKKDDNGRKMCLENVSSRSTKENERNRKRVPQSKPFNFNTDDRDTNSDTESVSSTNVLQRKNDGNMSKNAIAARENRLKKKKYIEDLENNSKRLAAENNSLKTRVQKQESAIQSLETDNKYLRSVLANVKEISALLRNVKNTPGVKFMSSLNSAASKRKHDYDLDHEYCTPPAKKRHSQPSTSSTDDSGTESLKNEDSQVGICLHISTGTVSLEFCPTCSNSASSLRRQGMQEADEDS